MHEKCNIQFERSVNQSLWNYIMWHFDSGEPFENEVFAIKPYNWADESDNDWNFWHKPSGFKMEWYKYPMRSPMVNIDINHEQFWAVLNDCLNSTRCGMSVDIDHYIWW